MLKERLREILTDDENIVEMSRCLSVGDLGDDDQYNLAGLILKARGYTLQLRANEEVNTLNQAKLPANAPHVDKAWIQYESEVHPPDLQIFDEHTIEIFALARQLWAEEYGELAAKELPFYADTREDNETPEWWWDDLEVVDAQDLLWWLEGTKPHNLNSPGEVEDDD